MNSAMQTPWISRLAGLIVCALLTFPLSALSAEEMLHFDTAEQQAFFEELTHEFRCLKCQNQTIASSGADLAGDLRNEIYSMVLAGKTRQEITGFLVQRYGDFVLYRPRFTLNTLLLWVGPALLLGGALWFAWSVTRRKSAAPAIDNDQLDQARSLLDD